MHTQLKQADIPLADLYLDPNNPRYADIGDGARNVPEHRVHEDTVQQRAMARMLDDRFEVQQLQDSIRTIGFLPVDRLVAVELPEAGQYMVVEGNRRLAALRTLINDEESGEIDLSPDIKNSILTVPVLILEDDDKASRNHTARILQGVRHVSSMKPWGPYQQAQLVAMMLDEGRSMLEIREVLGLATRRINMLRRVYYALEQMRKDPDFGPDAKPLLFSHFDEALKQPTLRDWLEWNEEQNKFMNAENRQMLYAWCVGMEEDGERHAPKIVDAKDSRYLPSLMKDPVQFKRFCEDPNLCIGRCC